jgi:predicted secreted protein
MPLRLPTTLRLTRAPLRTFTSSRPTFIKEGGNRTPAELEAAKQDQLKEQAEGKGRWREDLASRGESNIKADKEEVKDHGEHMKELQEEGKKMGEGGKLGGR